MANLEPGQWAWVSDPDDYRLPAQILEFKRGQGAKVKLQDDSVREVDAEAAKTMVALDPQCLDPNVDNLVGLSNLTEEAILHNLRIRFQRDCIYTCISSILIAVNPFRQLPLYTVDVLQHYATSREKASLPPHIFSVADRAFHSMLKDSVSQSVVISGESGAGKTESTKLILQYLAEVSGSINTENSIEQQILQANPLMEAFGNAKTVRNNNSSRFGKLITVYFNNNGEIVGGSVINYLLEKSRVSSVQESERNYHVFYELLAGVEQDPNLRASLLLDDDSYHYIRQSSVTTIEGVSDAEEFNDVVRAMEVLGIDEPSQLNIWKAVASILHLGNVVMESVQQDVSDDCARVSNKASLLKASELLGIPAADLEQNLTSRNIGNHSVIQVAYTKEQAIDARDAFCRMIYSKLFDWLIACINRSLGGARENLNYVAVLDIFGFESFETNSFEQLCINYCNEKLQFHFNHHIFSMEQAQYAEEGIPIEAIAFEDNQPTLELLEAKGTGIFALVDEETNVPKGSDEGFLNKCMAAHAKHPRFDRARPKLHKDPTYCFVVKHYAGDVAYNVRNFLDKDRDAIHPALQQLLTQSSNPLISEMMNTGRAKPESEAEEKAPPRARRGVQKRTQATLAMQFKQQLNDLMATLNTTEPHFVRCMKPNTAKVGKKFDSHLMLAQLRYAGLVEVCRIRQLGYPLRKPHDKFLQQFKMLAPGAATIDDMLKTLEDQGILKAGLWVKGRTQVFMKQEQLNELDARRDAAYYGLAKTMQKYVRAFIARAKAKMYKRILTDLREHMQLRDAEKIAQSLALSTELPHGGQHLEIVKEGKALLQRLKEEQRVEALLLDAIKERTIAALQAALRTAAQMSPPFESSVVTQASQLLDRVTAEKVHLKESGALLNTKDLTALQTWLKRAEELELVSTDEYKTVSKLVQRISEENALLQSIADAQAKELLDELNAFLSKAAEMGMESHPQVVAATTKRDELQHRRAALAALETALRSRSAETVQAAISKAEQAGVAPDSEVLLNAKKEVHVLRETERLEQVLSSAIDAEDTEQLEDATAEASAKLAEFGDHPAAEAVRATIEQARLKLNTLRVQAAALDALRAALANQSDMEGLQKAVSAAVQARCSGPELRTAQQLIAQSSKKSELKARLDEAVESENLARIDAAIAEAEAISMDAAELEVAKAARDRIAHEQHIASELQNAIIAANQRLVGAMLVQLKALGLKNKYPELVADAELMVSALKEQFEAEMALKSAMQAREVAQLEDAIKKAEASAVDSADIEAAKELLTAVVQEQGALAALKSALDANDRDKLAEALQRCKDLGITDHVVQQAQATFDRSETVGQVEALLDAADDASVLTDAIARAIQLGVTGERVDKAKARLQAMTGLNDTLVQLRSAVRALSVHAEAHSGLNASNVSALRTALEEYVAAGGDPSHPEADAAKTSIQRAEQQLEIQQTLSDATMKKDLHALRKAIDSAQAFGLSNMFTEFANEVMQQILLELAAAGQEAPEDEEDEEEEDDDNEEDEEDANRYYDRIAKAAPATYALANFSKLRTREDFARGILLNKKRVMESMLQYVPSPISKSLTKLDNNDSSEAVKIFRSFLAYTGDKPLAFPASLARDSFAKAIENPALRDEVYVQLMKHCTDNPSKQSEMRGWQLFAMASNAFPPSNDLLLYVVHFLLRKKMEGEPAVQHMAEYCLLKVGTSLPDQVCIVPDVEDIEAYSARPPAIVTIELYGPSFDTETIVADLAVPPEIDADSTAMLCCQEVGVNVERRNVLGLFAVYQKDGESEEILRCIPATAHVGDVFRQVAIQKYGRPTKFVFKRRTLDAAPDLPLDDESEEESNALMHMTFRQVAADVLADRLPLETSDAVADFAAMYLLTIAEVPSGDPEAVKKLGGMKCVPASWSSKMSEAEWCQLIVQKLAQYAGKADEELEAIYVNSLRDHPLFGLQQFSVKKGTRCSELGSALPDRILLYVDSQNLKFVDANDPSKEVILTVPVVAVVEHAAKSSSLTLKLRMMGSAFRIALPPNVASAVSHELELMTPLAEEILMAMVSSE